MALFGSNMNLREYLFIKRMTVTEISKMLECNRPYMSAIVNGRLKPSKRLAKDIERVTNGEVKAEEILKGE